MEIALANCYGHTEGSKCAKATCFKDPYIENLVKAEVLIAQDLSFGW